MAACSAQQQLPLLRLATGLFADVVFLKTSPPLGERYRFRGLPSTRTLKQLRIAATDAYPVHPPPAKMYREPNGARDRRFIGKARIHLAKQQAHSFYLAVVAIERETPEVSPAGPA